MTKISFDFDEHLNPVIETARDEDLEPLVRLMNEKASLLDDSLMKAAQKYPGQPSKYAREIAHELRLFGGHTIANVGRSTGPSYISIARDVGKRVGANFNKQDGIEAIEAAILMKVAGDAWEKMTGDQREAFGDSLGLKGRDYCMQSFPFAVVRQLIASSGFAAYRMSLVVANATFFKLLGTGTLRVAANTALTRVLAVAAGPIGIAASALWLAKDAMGPAYRIIIPAVLHVATLRCRASMLTCPNPTCGEVVIAGSNFCSACGTPLPGESV